jgi:multiple sugar transport system permease protein
VAAIPAVDRRRRPGARRRANLLPYLLIAPLALFILALAAYPMAVTFVQSWFRVDPLTPPVQFVGLANYTALFANPAVLDSWVNTAGYVAIGVALSTTLGIAMAVALRHNFRGRAVVIAILVLPWALPPVIEAMMWNWMYDPTFGIVNSLLTSLHLTSHFVVLIGIRRWLSIALIELVQVWQMTPLSVLLVLASLQAIPPELHDAAGVDGAHGWREFVHVTLPLIRPGLAIALVEGVIASLNVFDQVYLLNGGDTLAASVMLQTYDITFQNLNFGQGYAMSWLATLATVVVALGVLRLVYRRVDY